MIHSLHILKNGSALKLSVNLRNRFLNAAQKRMLQPSDLFHLWVKSEPFLGLLVLEDL